MSVIFQNIVLKRLWKIEESVSPVKVFSLLLPLLQIKRKEKYYPLIRYINFKKCFSFGSASILASDSCAQSIGNPAQADVAA